TKDLIDGTTGSLQYSLLPKKPLDAMAFRTIDGKLTLRPGLFPKVEVPFTADRTAGEVFDSTETANLCATVGAGNTRPVPVGTSFLVLLQCVNLGPSPL